MSATGYEECQRCDMVIPACQRVLLLPEKSKRIVHIAGACCWNCSPSIAEEGSKAFWPEHTRFAWALVGVGSTRLRQGTFEWKERDSNG